MQTVSVWVVAALLSVSSVNIEEPLDPAPGLLPAPMDWLPVLILSDLLFATNLSTRF